MNVDGHPLVLVRVGVNVDNLRAGDEGEVELTPRIQGLISAGYVQILGHIPQPPLTPSVLPPEPTPHPVAAPRRKTVGKAQKGADDGSPG